MNTFAIAQETHRKKTLEITGDFRYERNPFRRRETEKNQFVDRGR